MRSCLTVLLVLGASLCADETSSEHWSFRPLVRPNPPRVSNASWVRNPIDAFIARQHEERGLTPQLEAPREVLIRRLYLDLIGLPPGAKELDAFATDADPARYDRAVERLLDAPQHGERWARHWMDIWRYSDWDGFKGQLRSSQKQIWHWRDWIVESLNDDTPYDQMLRQMLAADELYPDDLDKLRATGYLARNWVLFNRNQWLDSAVEHVSKGMLGLTMDCAKCHDHKYDPITHRDYFAMRAFFEPYHVRVDVVPGQPDPAVDGIPRVFDGLLEEPTYLFVHGDEDRPDKSTSIAPAVPAFLSFAKLTIEPVSLPIESWQPARRPWVLESHVSATRRDLETAREDLSSAKANVTATAGQEEAVVKQAELELRVAELSVELQERELVSMKRRVEALRASWVRPEKTDGTVAGAPKGPERDMVVAAVRAERERDAARARRDLAAAELDVVLSVPEKRTKHQKKVARDKLEKAKESLERATKRLEQPVRPRDKYPLLVGAKWTPTRFRRSNRDDPGVSFPPTSSGRRTALARWITDPRHPLTARVAANHVWTRHMGRPLVESVFDFGPNGRAPTHPELLDWLASELIDSGWSLKHLHRLIVSSASYRLSSSNKGARRSTKKDPDNLRWWRRSPIRLESQLVRDAILAHAGRLEPTLGGPPVLRDDQESSTRRSLYFFHSASDRNRFLASFDEASVKECYRREQSVLPQQALALTNSRLVLESAPRIARRLNAGKDATTDREYVRRAFLSLLGIRASDAEITSSVDALVRWIASSDGDVTAARARFIWVLLNHNDFVTLR